MNGYLLDTCICVFLLRRKHNVAQRLVSLDPSQCYISEITIAELKYGAYKSGRPAENLALIAEFVGSINVVPFSSGIDVFAQEKNRLRASGTLVEDFDLLIASAALSQNLTLVTDNTKHFARIQGLTLENWIER